MVLIRYIKYMLLTLLLANGFSSSALAEDYYTYGSTSFSGFAPESYGSYVFAVGTDDQIHAWSVSIPSGADANDLNYQGSGTSAPRTFNHIGTIDLGFTNKSNQASLYVSSNTIWYGSGSQIDKTDGTGDDTSGLRPYIWEVLPDGTLSGAPLTDQDIIFDPDTSDKDDETIPDAQTLAYDESTDTWYTSTPDGKIYHLDDNNNWVEDLILIDQVSNVGGIEIEDGLLIVADMASEIIEVYENQGTVENPNWQIFSENNVDSPYEVNGLGFGLFDHLWVTSGDYLYELGAGILPVTTLQIASLQAVAVHEPAIWLLFMSNLMVLAFLRRKKFLNSR